MNILHMSIEDFLLMLGRSSFAFDLGTLNKEGVYSV